MQNEKSNMTKMSKTKQLKWAKTYQTIEAKAWPIRHFSVYLLLFWRATGHTNIKISRIYRFFYIIRYFHNLTQCIFLTVLSGPQAFVKFARPLSAKTVGNTHCAWMWKYLIWFFEAWICFEIVMVGWSETNALKLYSTKLVFFSFNFTWNWVSWVCASED